MADRIWIVSELYYPEETSTGLFLTGIAEGLARRHDVGVLCSQPTYSERGLRAPASERRHGVDIHRCAATTFGRHNLVLRLANILTISLSVFIRAVTVLRRNDLVLVVTNPPAMPFIVRLACKIRGARCILLVHDVYPEVLIAAGMAQPSSWLARAVGGLSAWMYRSMDCVITLGRDMRELAAKKLGPGGGPVVIIENWGDVEGIRPADRADNALLRRLGFQDKFVVQYCGNIGRTHGLESLLDAADMLREHEDIVLLIMGQGAKQSWLESAVRRRGLTNVHVLPRRPKAELADALNACDLAVIPFVAGMAGVSVPSRMYNVFASGKPLLAAAEDHSELARVVTEHDLGWVVPPDDGAAIARAVLEARSDPKRLADMGARARSAAERDYAYERIVERYQALIEEMH